MKIACLSMLSLILAPAAAGAATVIGVWLSPDGGTKARIAPCGTSVCGDITWMKQGSDPSTGRPYTDNHNPDPALRARPVLGMRFMSGYKAMGQNRWAGGKIYDPRSGRSYDSRLSLTSGNLLRLEGCVGLFCVPQIWRPAS